MKTPEQQTITNHTRITVGVAVTVLVFVIGGVITGIGEWDGTRAQIEELQKSQWTVTEQLKWTEEFQKQNPTIDIPIPQVASNPKHWPVAVALLLAGTNSP